MVVLIITLKISLQLSHETRWREKDMKKVAKRPQNSYLVEGE